MMCGSCSNENGIKLIFMRYMDKLREGRTTFTQGKSSPRNSSYTGRLCHHMCSCQPTVGLTILSLHKVCFHCTKSLFYSWLTTAHMVPDSCGYR